MRSDHKTDGSAPDVANLLPAAEDHTTDHTSYEVGYGKPPKAHRFKPGQSGNPKGRRKGRKNIKTFMQEELDRRLWVTVDGKRRRLSKREVIASQQINKAIKGDDKAFHVIIKHDTAMEGEIVNQARTRGLSDHDRELLSKHLAYFRNKQGRK